MSAPPNEDEKVISAFVAFLLACVIAAVGSACCGGTDPRPERVPSVPAFPSLAVETYRCHPAGPQRDDVPDVLLRATVRALGVELQTGAGETLPLECMIVPLPAVTP